MIMATALLATLDGTSGFFDGSDDESLRMAARLDHLAQIGHAPLPSVASLESLALE